MRPFLAAIQFLTVFPCPSRRQCSEKDLGRSLPYFPVVGLVIGALATALDSALVRLFPEMLSSVIVVVFLLLTSGGLHIDGLADTADGFLSSRPKERILDIMKDSRTGPMGVAAVVCVVVLKISALASVHPAARWWAVLMVPVAGRCALITNMAVLPYVRPEGGLGTVFLKNRSPLHAILALAFLGAAGWLAGGLPGAAAGLTSFAASLLWALHCYRKIGGLTGDTLGAACELVEIVPALVAAACVHGGASV